MAEQILLGIGCLTVGLGLVAAVYHLRKKKKPTGKSGRPGPDLEAK